MKYAAMVKVPRAIAEDGVAITRMREGLLMKYHKGLAELDGKGKKVVEKGHLKISFYEQDGDNFIQDLVTIIVERPIEIYRVPRILNRRK